MLTAFNIARLSLYNSFVLEVVCLWVRVSFARSEIPSAPVKQAGSTIHVFVGGNGVWEG